MIEFDSEKHEFSLNGKIVPSVTQILKAADWIDTRWYNEDGRIRGIHIHEACAMIDENSLDWGSVDEDILPYLLNYEEAKTDLGFRVTANEVIVNQAGLWAGIVDKEAIWQRCKTIIDIKSGGREPWHKAQIVGYGSTYKKMPKLMILYLKPKGYSIDVVEGDMLDEFRLGWSQMVSQYHWFRKWNK